MGGDDTCPLARMLARLGEYPSVELGTRDLSAYVAAASKSMILGITNSKRLPRCLNRMSLSTFQLCAFRCGRTN